MQNIQQQLFSKSIEQFARTIVIKNSDAAKAINTALLESGYSVNQYQPATWKYYLNLAGIYHVSNVPMQIVSLDTLDVIDFNVASLQEHLGTLREYYYGSSYYNELVEKYPKQVLLINGILNPIPLEVSIPAPEGQILYFDGSLIEPQETNLISNIQKWVFDHLKTWDKPGYRSTDELYHLTLWAPIYAHMAAAVRTVRWENCHTIRAHSYHIWNFLESNGRLGAYRRYLTIKQALWLYRNIRWVNSNAGLTKTFRSLLEVVLTQRRIPLGEYEYVPDVSAIGAAPVSLSSAVNADAIVDTESGLNVTARLMRRPINMLDVVSKTPILKTVLNVSEKQIPLSRDNGQFLIENVKETTEALTFSPFGRLPIKTYESDMVDTTDQQVYSLNDFLLNHWLYLSTNDRYTSFITVANPKTTDLMTMTMSDAFVVFMYSWAKVNGFTLNEIPDLQAVLVRRPQLPTRAMLRNIFPKGKLPDATLLALIKDQLPLGVTISTEGFYKLVHGIWKTIIRHYKLVSYEESHTKRAYLEAVVLAFYQSTTCVLKDHSGQTFEEYFLDRGWEISDLSKVDLEIMQEDIWQKASGLDTQAIIRVKDIQNAMISLMQRLGTYAVQYLQSINDQSAIVVHRPAVRCGDPKEHQFFRYPVGSGIRVMDTAGSVFGKARVTGAQKAADLTISQCYNTRAKVTGVIPFTLSNDEAQSVRVRMHATRTSLLNEGELNRTLPPNLDY